MLAPALLERVGCSLKPAKTLEREGPGGRIVPMSSVAHDDVVPWTELRDATLVDVQLDWISGVMRLALRPKGTVGASQSIVATNLRSLQCPRRFPWGDSVTIDELRPPVETNEGSQIEIQMQSGDLVIVLAQSFELQPTT